MNDSDILAVVIREVKGMLPGVWVADHLPEGEEMITHLPCVVIDLLPGSEAQVSWGGMQPVRLDHIALDVEVFGRSRGDATPVADRVRAALHQLPHLADTGVTSVDCPRMSTREDLNPHVKALGVTVDLVMHV